MENEKLSQIVATAKGQLIAALAFAFDNVFLKETIFDVLKKLTVVEMRILNEEIAKSAEQGK